MSDRTASGHLPSGDRPPPPACQPAGDRITEEDVDHLERALLTLDAMGIREVLARAAARGPASGSTLADELIVPALTRIGDGWESGAVALSQVYMSARLLEQALGERVTASVPRRPSPVIGVGVLGDFHVLGKRIVVSVLASAGYDVRDLGAGLSADVLLDRAVAADVQVLMVSALMLNHALQVRHLVARRAERGLSALPVVVGGAPFVHDPELWRRVGADVCGGSAADALRIAAGYTGGAA